VFNKNVQDSFGEGVAAPIKLRGVGVSGSRKAEKHWSKMYLMEFI
jgi:hypothetical protein